MNNWICELCNKKFKEIIIYVLHLGDKVVCSNCYNKNGPKNGEIEEI